MRDGHLPEGLQMFVGGGFLAVEPKWFVKAINALRSNSPSTRIYCKLLEAMLAIEGYGVAGVAGVTRGGYGVAGGSEALLKLGPRQRAVLHDLEGMNLF